MNQFPAKIYRLSNGLTVIHQQVAASPVVVTDVWVRSGARLEPETWTGVAHLLEHAIFRGTERLAPGAFDEAIEGFGGIANAATSHDYAHFFMTTAAAYWSQSLPYLAEILLHASIAEGEFERERGVVAEEIRACFDNPDWLGFQVLCECLYPKHAYGRSILGDLEQLEQRSPQEVRCFHRAHYRPESMCVVVVGDVSAQTAVAEIEKRFSEFSAYESCMLPDGEKIEPLSRIHRQELRLPHVEQARLILGWSAPGIEDLESAIGLDVLATILAGGQTSRLIWELREEEQLVFDLGCDFSMQQDASLLTISAILPVENLERVEERIQKAIAHLSYQEVEESELQRVKRLLCNDYAFSTDTPGQLAGLYGYYQTLACLEQAAAYPQLIRQFQSQDLQHLAAQHLSDRYAITTILPL